MSEFDLGYSMCANGQERTASIDLAQLDRQHELLRADLKQLEHCMESCEQEDQAAFYNLRAFVIATIHDVLARCSLTSGAPAEAIAADRRKQSSLQALYDAGQDIEASTQTVPEAFAWAAFADNGNVIIWSRSRTEVEPVAAKYGKPVVPVIAYIDGRATKETP